MIHLLVTRDRTPLLALPLDRDVTAAGSAGAVDLLVEDPAVAPLAATLDEKSDGSHRFRRWDGEGATVMDPFTPGSSFHLGPFVAHCRGEPRDRGTEPEWARNRDGTTGRSGECEGMVFAAMRSLLLLQRLQADRLRHEPWAVVGEAGAGKRRLAEALGRFERQRGGVREVDCGRLGADAALAAVDGPEGMVAAGGDPHDRALLREAQGLPEAAQAALARIQGRRLLFSFRSHPDRLLAEGKLSPRLHARLRNIYMLPPLRERREEIGPIFERLLSRFSPGEPPSLSPSAADALRRHPWPGNMREFQSVAQRLLLRRAGPVIGEDDLRLFGPPN